MGIGRLSVRPTLSLLAAVVASSVMSERDVQTWYLRRKAPRLSPTNNDFSRHHYPLVAKSANKGRHMWTRPGAQATGANLLYLDSPSSRQAPLGFRVIGYPDWFLRRYGKIVRIKRLAQDLFCALYSSIKRFRRGAKLSDQPRT